MGRTASCTLWPSRLARRAEADEPLALDQFPIQARPAPPAGAALPQVPKVDFAKFGEIELQKLTRIQKISGPRLQASWINLPHVTQHDLADITDLEAIKGETLFEVADRQYRLTPHGHAALPGA